MASTEGVLRATKPRNAQRLLLPKKKVAPCQGHAHIDPQSGDCRVVGRDLGECAASTVAQIVGGWLRGRLRLSPMALHNFSDNGLFWSFALFAPQNCAAAADARMTFWLGRNRNRGRPYQL